MRKLAAHLPAAGLKTNQKKEITYTHKTSWDVLETPAFKTSWLGPTGSFIAYSVTHYMVFLSALLLPSPEYLRDNKMTENIPQRLSDLS